MKEYSKLDVRAFVSRYAVWIAKTRTQDEANVYAQKILKENPEILNLVLEDIKLAVQGK
ncbi:hypothetical protein [Sphingobacterium sp.]|uniref:hypothetical protein n=1 Tax=Sphingobacterium sp. TaxID=341027 RepID=UPI0028AEA125|nr:hypothetical protein [Sphingobacterium sp.]